MRMLLISTVPGTLRLFLIPYVEHFQQKGWHTDGMARGVSQDPELKAVFNNLWDIPLSRNPFAPCNLISAPRKLRQIVAGNRYDLVHVHTPVAAFVTRMGLRGIAPINQTKIVYTAHGFHFQKGRKGFKNTLFMWLEKIAGKWTDSMIVINDDDYRLARDHGFVLPEKLFYMPGIGIDTSRYCRLKVGADRIQAIRGELGLHPQDRLLLMLAGFDPGKRHRDALHAMAKLRRDNIHLALAGNGRLRAQMEELAGRLGLRHRVHFLGFRRDIPELICASDIVILPSEREGLPRSIMEAQALETPCIGSDIRGIRDLLGNGCGMLFRVGDIEGLSSAIERLLSHPEEASAIVRSARDHLGKYELGKILRLHEDLYAQTLAS